MRKFRIFLVELVLVAIAVGWSLEKAPQMFDRLMPWIIMAVVWHLAYECLWESTAVTIWTHKTFSASKAKWIFFASASLVLCIAVWFGARQLLNKIPKSYPNASDMSHPLGPPPQPSSGVTINQTATGSDCSNIVAKDAKIKCEAEKANEKKYGTDKSPSNP